MRTAVWIIDLLIFIPLVLLFLLVSGSGSVWKIVLFGDARANIQKEIGSVYSFSVKDYRAYSYNSGEMISLENGKNYLIKSLRFYGDIDQMSAWFVDSDSDSQLKRTAVIYGKPEALDLGSQVSVIGGSYKFDTMIDRIVAGDWKTYQEAVNGLEPDKFLLVYKETDVNNYGKYTIFRLSFPVK